MLHILGPHLNRHNKKNTKISKNYWEYIYISEKSIL